MSETPLFDAYVESYDEALEHALVVTGSDKDYFCEGRMTWLTRCLTALGEQPRRGLDYGCGNGSSSPLLTARLKLDKVTGIDVAPKTIARAREQYGTDHVRFATLQEAQNEARYAEEFDIAYCNGVFHHIPESERPGAIDFVYSSLRPAGIFALWENNPWNPAARYVMSRCAFDEDAQMLSAFETKRLLRNAGFEILRTDFLFIFPEFLKVLRPLERPVRRLPFGAQYQVLARKSSASGRIPLE